MKRALALVFTFCFIPVFAAAPTTVQNLRLWRAPDNTRLVFDLGGSVEHQIFVLEGPDRIVVDLSNARFQGALPDVEPANPLLSSIRTGRPDGTTQRFVLDLKRAVKPRSFVLKPVGQYGHRLVIDLVDPQAEVLEEVRAEQEEAAAPPVPVPTPSTPVPVPPPATKKEWVIAIDAGHGGEDPGALGRQLRTREKDVTLAIARELERLVRDEPGMRPVLIRDGDYFVDLKQRWHRAKVHKADIFISIHADAMPGRKLAFGSSVYALSERGATNALAAAVADQANYSELVGGVSLSDKAPDVRRTIMDLSLDKKIEYSLLLANDILDELRQVGRVHQARPAQAGFAVFKSIEIPSVLVETAFISTPEEERKLRDSVYQHKLASAILKGSKRYLVREGYGAPVVQQVAVHPAREHVVKSGDTLKSIARQYNVSVDVLRFLNELTSDDVPIGLRLRLPAGS